MTLIDKAEALAPCPFCGGEANARIWERDNGDAYAGVECTDCRADNSVAVMWFDDGKKELAEAIASWNRRAALPARGVGVTWHPFDTAPRDGSRFLAQGGGLDAVDICSYNARVGCWDCGAVTLDDTDQEPEGYNRPAQWMPLAALAPTDAPHVNETPKGATGDDCCGGYCDMDDDQKGGDAHAIDPRHAPHEASPGLTAGAEAVAWQSTTEAFIPFVTDARYRKFSPAVQKHYVPYRCPSCTDAAQAREATFRDGWGFAYRQWQATGSVPDPDYKPITSEART